MFDPVYPSELMLAERRSRALSFRRIYTGWLVLQLAVLFAAHWLERETPGQPIAMRLTDSYLQFFLLQHTFLLVIATPAFFAGAITDEKSQGTLLELLTTDLAAGEIVLAKFCARLGQVLVLALAGVPFICFLSGFGYLTWTAPLGLALVSLLLVGILAAYSVWTSVRSQQTRSAALRVYGSVTAIVAMLVAFGYGWPFLRPMIRPASALTRSLDKLRDGLRYVNPIELLEPTWLKSDIAEFGRRYLAALAVYGSLTLIFLGLAIWRLRPTALSRPMVRRRFHLPRWVTNPRTVNDEPIRWRERVAGNRLLRLMFVGLVLSGTIALGQALVPMADAKLFLFEGLLAAVLAGFVAGIRASGAVSGEREQKTWEALLLTPLETWELVYDKLHGILLSLYPYYLAYALPACYFAWRDSYESLIYAVSTLIMVWASMYYMTATGVWCSVSSRGSWRSLVATMASGFGYFFGILFLFGIAYAWMGCLLGPIFSFFLRLAGFVDVSNAVIMTLSLTTSIGFLLILRRGAFSKVRYAESWIDDRERYGRNFTRSLSRALVKYEQQRLQKARNAMAVPAAQGKP